MKYRWLTAQNVRDIPQEDLPLLVFSDNIKSLFAWTIKAHQRGHYNHLMWMHKPGYFASQDWIFKEVSIEKYLKGKHRLKFWALNFTEGSKNYVRKQIYIDLSKPWYKRLYDPVQIVGKLFKRPELQLPYFDICSDKVKYLRRIDATLMIELSRHRSPTEVNKYLQTREDGYFQYGRHIPN